MERTRLREYIVLCIFILFVLSCFPAHSLTFTQKPLTTYAFINTTAEFECICKDCDKALLLVNGKSHAYWHGQGKDVEQSDGQKLGQNKYKYTLTVSAVAFFNDSNILCIIYSGTEQLKSSVAKLYIQGIVSAVSNLSVLQCNETTLKITFSAPFTIHKSVSVDYYIIELVDNKVKEFSQHKINVTGSTIGLFYNVDYCSDYNVLVTPYNSLGAGQVNAKEEVIVYGEAETYRLVTISSKIINNQFNAWIQFQTNTSCVGTVPRTINVTISCETQDGECLQTNVGPCSLNILNESISKHYENCSSIVTVTGISDTVTAVEIDISDYISRGCYYKIDVLLTTASLPWISSNRFALNLGTFHTIRAEITSFSSDGVCIKCFLRSDSPEEGCLAIFLDHISEKELTSVINRIPGEDVAFTCITSLPDGVYRLSVTDIVHYKDGVVKNQLQHAFILKNNLSICCTSNHLPKTFLSSQLALVQSTKPSQSESTKSGSANSFQSSLNAPASSLIGLSGNYTGSADDTHLMTLLLLTITGWAVVAGLVLCNIITLVICIIRTRKRKSFAATLDDSRYGDVAPPCSWTLEGNPADNCKSSQERIYEELKPEIIVNLNKCSAYEAVKQKHHTTAAGISHEENTDL